MEYTKHSYRSVMTVFLLFISMFFFCMTNVEASGNLTIDSHQNGDTLDEDTVRVSGSYTNVTSIHLLINGSTKRPVVNSGDGNWYYDLDTSTYNGDIELLATGTDIETRYTIWSNIVNGYIINPSADTPVVKIISPGDGSQLLREKTKVKLSVEAVNELASVEIRVNGSEWMRTNHKNDGYEYKWEIHQDNQTYSLEARATDMEGNVGYSATTYVYSGEGSQEATQFINQNRAMWIWENASYNLLYNEGSRHVLDAMAKDTSTFGQDEITTLYLGVDRYFGVDMLEDERDRVRNLVSWAHDNGYKVHALIAGGTSPPYFGAYERYHDIAIQEFENILNYNLSSQENEKFDGVNIDIEPYIAPEFKTDKPSLQLQYLDLLQIFMNRKEIAGSGLFVGAAIPRWYDSSPNAEAITWGASNQTKETKWLSEHIQDIVDYISIMDYRDTADGSAGIISQAQGEIDYANEIGKPNSVVIGVETKDIADGGDPEVISFREEGRTYMEAELDKVENAFSGDVSYGGIALHHYDTIRYLPSEWSPDAVYWKPPEDSIDPSPVSSEPVATALDYQSISITYGRAYDNQEVEEYYFYRSTSPDFEANASNLVGSSRRLDYTDEGLLAKTQYFYKVAAIDVNGNIGPSSSVTSATTSETELKPLIIKHASIQYDGTKGTVSLQVIDKDTSEGVMSTVGGRFTMLSGLYINTETDSQGYITFSSENLPNGKGQLGFKVNRILSEGYYWASAYDEYDQLSTEWVKNTIPVQEDAHVRSGSYGDENYGAAPLLEIKDVLDTKSSNYDRSTYLKFDLSSVQTSSVSNGLLHFYVNSGVTDANVSKVPMTITGITDDGWSEDTITWDTTPSNQEGTLIGEVDIVSKGWYSIDITDYVNSELNDKTITILLSDKNATDRTISIQSKENTYSSYLDIY
ncbi:DNRLRE domain-containing protein [Pontibacillus yanchengensis]|uniref:DNRLRE domain-containing protein n=2 Tax=Pontibacillus yanchengensis TaxID=462910 RepID=A0A6I4ZX45_9BACI|nr:DNRLRE domain-containing protein [Pontibacillus yanchengensis]